MRLLLLVFAHHHYLIETAVEGERGKTTELTSCGYQRKFLLHLCGGYYFFISASRIQQGDSSALYVPFTQSGMLVAWAEVWVGGFFCKCFTFFPIDVGKVLCNFPVTLIMQLCVTTALDNIKDATCYQVVGSPSRARDTQRAPGRARGRWPSSPPWLMSCSWGSSYCSRSIFWRGKVAELAVIKHTEASAGRWRYTANKLKLLISPSK